MRSLIILCCVVLVFRISWAQTGPGGVGSSSSNVLWLSADDGVYSDAGTTPAADMADVAQWNDRSGNSANASHTVAGEQPNLRNSTVNGLPVITFTAAGGDRLLSTGLATANQGAVWAVASRSTLPSSNPGIVQGSPAGLAFSASPGDKVVGVWVSSANNNLWGRGIQSNNTSRDIPQVTSLTAGTFYSLLTQYNGSSITQYVNNGIAGSITYNGTLKSWSDFGIGRQGGESWNGDIAEIIVYNQSLNTAQRIIVDNYLAAKYGLTLSANDIYTMDDPGNGNFDHEVAGIGRVNSTNLHNDAQGSGIVRISGPGNLDNNEYFFWGHDNGTMETTNTTDIPAGIQARLERVWAVTETNATAGVIDVGSINIEFDLTGQGPVTASDLRLLIDDDGDGDFSELSTIQVSGAVASGGDRYRFNGVTGITNRDRFTLGTVNKTQTPLPIELLSFTGKVVSGVAHLTWITSTELNNDHFTIERSVDGENFHAVGKIPGSGTTLLQKTYEYKDVPPYGRIYYRLKQTDYDNRYSYSDVIALENDAHEIQLIALPNPVDRGNQVRILIRHHEMIDVKHVQIRVSDLTGRNVDITTSVEDTGDVLVTFRNFQPAGIYIVSAVSADLGAPLYTRILVR